MVSIEETVKMFSGAKRVTEVLRGLVGRGHS